MSVNVQTQWPSVMKLCNTVLSNRDSGVLVSRWKHWEHHKGTTWLVERCKILLNVSKLLMEGRVATAESLLKEGRIACSASAIPSGVEGRLILRAAGTNPRTSKKAIAILRAYTGMFLPEATESQIKKASRTINGPYTGFHPNQIGREEWLKRHRGTTVPEFYFRDKKIALEPLSKLRAMSRYPHDICERTNYPYGDLVSSMSTRGFVPQSLLDCYDEADFMPRQWAQGIQSLAGHDYLGSVVILQEGGAKARVICSPNGWIQYYMYPLHNCLFNLIKQEESGGFHAYGLSCVTDQLRGVYHAHRVMAEGGYVQSADLSAATDRFPLWLQQTLLSGIGLDRFAKAFEDLKGPYKGPDGQEWSYATGQPMGIYSSFPLFHLTHLWLIRHACRLEGLDKTEVHFAILGDDVLFFNKNLHRRYLDLMKGLGVDISQHKSFGGAVTEFAGFLMRSGHKPYRPYKWGRNCTFGPVIPTLYTFTSSLTGWWQRKYRLFERTVGMRDLSLSPLVPADVPLEGTEPGLTARYVLSLIARLDAQHSAPHIHSVTPKASRLREEWVRVIQNDNDQDGFDIDSFVDRQVYQGPVVVFNQDPLIKQLIKLSD